VNKESQGNESSEGGGQMGKSLKNSQRIFTLSGGEIKMGNAGANVVGEMLCEGI